MQFPWGYYKIHPDFKERLKYMTVLAEIKLLHLASRDTGDETVLQLAKDAQSEFGEFRGMSFENFVFQLYDTALYSEQVDIIQSYDAIQNFLKKADSIVDKKNLKSLSTSGLSEENWVNKKVEVFLQRRRRNSRKRRTSRTHR